MTCKDVTTQSDLNEALADSDVSCVHIRSERGVWLTLRDNQGRSVGAYDSATVEAYGSATVRASGSATVRAYDSATVRAYDSATVRASGSATVEASGSATVHGYYRARVKAGRHVAVHLHEATVTVEGGVVIDVSQLDLTDPETWADHHGVDVGADGLAVLYKAVDDEYTAGRGYDKPTRYMPGEKVTCDDWRADNSCGGGLHLSPTSVQARTYNSQATRYVEVVVPIADLRPIRGDGIPKCKIPAGTVLREVDLFRRTVTREPETTDA